jgi:uncharacterized RmlC-like cupin family protein
MGLTLSVRHPIYPTLCLGGCGRLGSDSATTAVVEAGRGQIRWDERLRFAAEVGPGDLVYFAPYVPHQELNLALDEALDFVSVRSNDDGIVVNLDVASVELPETMF